MIWCYLAAELRNSLPSMVVEILEKKMERENIENMAEMLMMESAHLLPPSAADPDQPNMAQPQYWEKHETIPDTVRTTLSLLYYIRKN